MRQLSAALFVSTPKPSLYVVDATTTTASSSYVPIGAKSGRTLLQRLQSKLSSSLLADAYIQLRADSGASVEGFTVGVIDRISELQTSEANKHRKTKALVDVRKSLEELGLRYTEDELHKLRKALSDKHTATTHTVNLTESLTTELLAVPELFEQQPLSSVFTLPSSSTASSAAGFFLSDTYAVLRVLSEQCDEYTWKVVGLVGTMRVKVNQHHTDLSAGEVRKGKGMLEYLTQLVANLRGDIGQLAREMQGVGHWLDSIQLLAQPPTLTSSDVTDTRAVAASDDYNFWQHKDLLDSLVTALEYYRCLYVRLAEALDTASSMQDQLRSGQATVQSLLAVVQTLKAEMDAEAERVYPSLLCYGQKPHSKELLALRYAEWTEMVQRHKQHLAALWTQHNAMELPLVRQSEGLSRLFLSILRPTQREAAHVDELSQDEVNRLQRRAEASLHKVVTIAQELVLAISETARVQQDEEPHETAESGHSELSLVDEFKHHTGLMTVKCSGTAALSKKARGSLFQQLRASLDAHLHNVARLARQPSTSAAFSTSLASQHSLVPALQQCSLVAQRVITSALAFLRSATKLDYVLLSSFNTLLTHGFCGKDTEQDKQDSGKTDEGVEGTGMGEGEGEKDVSDQLQEEHQLEGLRDEEKDAREQQQDSKGEEKSKEEMEKGMEMEQEFEGDMHDMPDDDDNRKEDDEDDEREQDELDREMVDEDDKQQVVDERLWNESDEEEEEQRDRTQEKEERGDSVRGNEEHTESVAKDEHDEQQAEEAKQQKEQQTGEEKEETKESRKDKDEVDVEYQAEEGAVNDNEEDKAEDDHNIEPFQLPDDVKLDDDEQNTRDKEEGQVETEGEGKEEEGMEDGDELTEEERKQLEGEQKEEEGAEDEGEEKLEEDKNSEQKMENDQAEVDDVNDRIAPAEADKTQEEKEEEGEEETKEGPDEEEQPPSDDKTVDQQLDDQQALGEQREEGGTKGGKGQQAEDRDKQRKQREEKQNPDQETAEENEEEEEVGASNADEAQQGQESEWRPAATNTQPQQEQQQHQQKQKKRKQEVKANPYKSLGDALKQWQERLRLLEQSETEQQLDIAAEDDDVQQLNEMADEEITGAVENVSERDKADAQMLGPVEEKEEKLEFPKDEKPEDEQEAADEKAEAVDDDVNMKEADEEAKDSESEQDKSKRDRAKTAARPTSQLSAGEREKKAEEDGEEDELELLDREQAELDEKDDEVDEKQSTIGPVVLDTESATQSSLLSPVSYELLRQLRAELDSELQSAPTDTRAAQMWQHLVSITSPLSHQLCETLRTVLEPTLASRLRGDYKTGKRLNLKRIIPYIASHFRRDKIWLRRTQASQRTYQVLLAIDDSLSMQRAGGGRMALEATTTITQALSQLEVGEVAVVKYGDSLRLLHPFDRQWTDDSGRYAVSQFSFKQTTTRWPTVLQQLIQLMGAASAGRTSSGTECLQLCFLISDGQIQQDRDDVRHWTREAQRRHILLVLIIVDTAERSIASTSRYVGGATGKAGKGGLMFEGYLDNFPFPYYLVLRQIEQLPHVLADALRQWFEIVQQTNSDS